MQAAGSEKLQPLKLQTPPFVNVQTAGEVSTKLQPLKVQEQYGRAELVSSTSCTNSGDIPGSNKVDINKPPM
jgi:hypothetical protein